MCIRRGAVVPEERQDGAEGQRVGIRVGRFSAGEDFVSLGSHQARSCAVKHTLHVVHEHPSQDSQSQQALKDEAIA